MLIQPPAESEAAPSLEPTVSLGALLESFSEDELVQLAERTRVRLDRNKRIGFAQQLARGLVVRPEHTSLRGLSAAERAVLVDLARGLPLNAALLESSQRLVERGWLFERPAAEGRTPLLPCAYLLQLPSWDGEDPLSFRRLLSLQAPEVANAIVRFYGGHAIAPWALALETSYALLLDPARLARTFRELGDGEARLLRALCLQGGEAHSSELLELERDPLRLQGPLGVVQSRRGLSFELERRAFLLAAGNNRFAVPTPVQALVLGGARERLKQNQLALAAELARTTTEPLRAQYSRDPVPFVLAMALLIAQREGVHTTVGTPRSLLAELAKLLGLELEQVALLAALSRKLGLWSHTLEPYRELGVVADLGPGLLEIWQGGSAWDFGREEPEVLRAATSARQPSPARDLAASLLRALLELAQDRWVPVEIFGRLVLGEPSLLTLQARLGQWSKRVGLASGDTAELLGHALVDLFTLGVIDQAELGDVSESAAIRLNTRGAEARAHGISRLKLAQDGAKARLAEADGAEPSLSVVGDPAALCFRVETATSLRQLLNAAHCFEIDRLDGQLFLRISADRIAARVLAGTTAAQLRSQLEPLAAWTEPVEALVAESTRPRARLDFVPSLGFLWIEDDALRLRLSSHPSTAALFLEPSPLGGLLVRANVGLERLVKACRAAGVVVWHDAGLLGAKRSRVTGKARTPEQR